MGRPPHAITPSCWRALDLFPPIVVRLNARVPTVGKGRRWPAHAEVAISAGLSFSRVLAISESLSWERVRIGEARRFCAACGFDPTNAKDRKRMATYLNLCQKTHPNQPPHLLRSSPQWETEIQPLIALLRGSMERSGASEKSAFPAVSSAA